MEKKLRFDLKIIALSFTNRCNLSCIHCGYDDLNRSRSQELPAEFFIKILTEGQRLGANNVNITGGEIFLRDDCLDLVEAAVGLGYFVTLESNGTLITDNHLSRLKLLGDKIRLAVSLDGFTKDVHEGVRGEGTFVKTMEVLEKLSQAKIPARINTVLQNSNLKQIPDIAEMAVDRMGLGFRLLPFILEYGKGACACNSIGVEYAAIKKLLGSFFYPFLRERKSEKITLGLNIALVPTDIQGYLICPWGQSMIGIGPTGIASLCHVSNNNPQFVFGDLKKETLADIWLKNAKLQEFRDFNPDILQGVCGNCLARSVCRGGCRLNAMSKYQHSLAPDSQCQIVYELGKFPKFILEDSKKDCHYKFNR
jgi:radical SAM protein with 4Fe4S-binding SPASM domain